MSHETRAHLNKLAVETFLEVAIRGCPFADCLGSVLLTGMEFARGVLNNPPAEAVTP